MGRDPPKSSPAAAGAARTGLPGAVDRLGGTSSGAKGHVLGLLVSLLVGARVDRDMGGLGTAPKPGHGLHPVFIVQTLLERQNVQ